jgi:hypothetical protein
VLQYRFSWKQLSVIAGISYWRFYFRLFNGSIKRKRPTGYCLEGRRLC